MEVVDDNSNSEIELDEGEVVMLDQLQKMAQVMHKSDELDGVENQLKRELEMLQTEQSRLRDYKRELELLNQERIAHVEELRLIHADINLLETTIKAAEEAEKRVADDARRLLSKGASLRDGVDSIKYDLRMQSDSGGHSPLPTTAETLDRNQNGLEGNDPSVVDVFSQAQRLAAIQAVAASIGNNASVPFNLMQSVGSGNARQSVEPTQSNTGGSQPQQSSSGGAIFRQQPPPMKMCLSCHQQIHRNAPICPLCKAKSRSRNPKKPKRKVHDE